MSDASSTSRLSARGRATAGTHHGWRLELVMDKLEPPSAGGASPPEAPSGGSAARRPKERRLQASFAQGELTSDAGPMTSYPCLICPVIVQIATNK
jgi:hypothetical protein